MGREEWSPLKAWVRMFSQGVLGRMVCLGTIQAGNLLREAAVCPVAASEPVNRNLVVLQGHGQPPHWKKQCWGQLAALRVLCGAKTFVFAKENNKVLQGQAETLWPYRAYRPPQIPETSVTPGEGSARSSPCSPRPCWTEACSWMQVAVGKIVKHLIQSVNLPLPACMFPGNKQ